MLDGIMDAFATAEVIDNIINILIILVTIL